MWELVSFMLGMGVFMLIMNYWMEPKKLIEDIRSLKGSSSKVEELEARVAELERIVKSSNLS
ncbi:hypothetical protein [Pseudoalteromonas sp.]|uniref:hypothetical protein n=1 Tax=Pseudoalteromonas sp. TaxID=53249 RepID=UPI003564383E